MEVGVYERKEINFWSINSTQEGHLGFGFLLLLVHAHTPSVPNASDRQGYRTDQAWTVSFGQVDLLALVASRTQDAQIL